MVSNRDELKGNVVPGVPRAMGLILPRCPAMAFNAFNPEPERN